MKRFKLSEIIAIMILLILPAQYSLVFSQEESTGYKSYEGVIKSSENNDILPYASVVVDGTNIATISNLDGEFLIKINNNLNATSLSFSSLGFKNKVVPLSEFNEGKVLTIELEPVTRFIKELTVRPSDASQIIDQVMMNIKENYHSQAVMMKGFYRETIKNRRSYVGIAEAVVDIYKAPYSNYTQVDQVKIDRGRKSSNIEKMDTLLVKQQGGPAVTMLLDIIKNPGAILTYDYMDIYDFEIENIVSLDDRLHYVISFKQKKEITDPFYYGKLYIEIDRLALTEAEFSLNLENKEEASRVFVSKKPVGVTVTPENTLYRVKYSIQNDQWYFNYARAEIKFKLNWKKKVFNSNYTIMSEIAITDRNATDVAKINRDQRFQKNDFLEEKVYAFFDPEYWGDYNLIEPDQSIETAIKKLYKQNK